MVQADSNWRIMVFRPGDDPIKNLAAAMDAPDALGSAGELASTNRVLLEATLHEAHWALYKPFAWRTFPPRTMF